MIKRLHRPPPGTTRVHSSPDPGQLETTVIVLGPGMDGFEINCERYAGWLNDPAVTCYLETEAGGHTADSCRQYITDVNGRGDVLLGVFAYGSHIGNVKLGSISDRHRRADVGYIIGDKDQWGFGHATRAVALAQLFAREMGLRKLTAGIYSDNHASRTVLRRNGFYRCGMWQDHAINSAGEWTNVEQWEVVL